VFWFPIQILFVACLILRRTERDMIKNVYWSSCKVPFNLIRSWWNLNFLDSFSKNFHIPNFMKILPVRAELIHADRRTDRHGEANSRFSQFFELAHKSFVTLHRITGGWRSLRTATLHPQNIGVKKKLRGLSPRANYTDRAAAAGRRS